MIHVETMNIHKNFQDKNINQLESIEQKTEHRDIHIRRITLNQPNRTVLKIYQTPQTIHYLLLHQAIPVPKP